MTDAETVWVSRPASHGIRGAHYHADEDCQKLVRADDTEPWDRDQAEVWKEPCSHCVLDDLPEKPGSPGGSKSTLELLIEAGAADGHLGGDCDE